MKKLYIHLSLLISLLIWISCSNTKTENPVPTNENINGWIIRSGDSSQIFSTIKKAHLYKVNHIQFSHNLIMNIDDLLDSTSEALYRIETINKGVELAHSLGMKTYVWCHEFSVKDRSKKEICYAPDSPIWEKRKQAYNDGLKLIPENDGVILMYGSSPIGPWRTTCQCDWCKANGVADRKSNSDQAKRIKILTEQVGGYITNELNKELFIRTFVHEPEEIIWYNEGLSNTENVPFIAMHKSPVQDWEPYNPQNPCIGQVINKKFIVENDVSGEFMGHAVLPYCSPGYYIYRLNYMKEKGGAGTVTRVDIRDQTVLGTPNFINLFAITSFNNNSDISLDSVWENSIQELYGEKIKTEAIPMLKKLFEKTFFIRVKSNLVLGIWAYDQSSDFPKSLRLSQFNYRGDMPKWDSNWVSLWTSLDKPDISAVYNIWQESTEAVELAEECLNDCPQLKPLVDESVYNNLEIMFTHQNLAAKAWRAIDIFTWANRAYMLANKDENEKSELSNWRSWAYWELKLLLDEYNTDELSSLPVMNYYSLKRYMDEIEKMDTTFQKTNFIPKKPLFSSIQAQYNDDEKNLTVTFEVKSDCMVDVLYGEKLPFPEKTEKIKALPGRKNKIVLTDILPDKRYIVRLKKGNTEYNLFSGDYWVYTY